MHCGEYRRSRISRFHCDESRVISRFHVECISRLYVKSLLDYSRVISRYLESIIYHLSSIIYHLSSILHLSSITYLESSRAARSNVCQPPLRIAPHVCCALSAQKQGSTGLVRELCISWRPAFAPFLCSVASSFYVASRFCFAMARLGRQLVLVAAPCSLARSLVASSM